MTPVKQYIEKYIENYLSESLFDDEDVLSSTERDKDIISKFLQETYWIYPKKYDIIESSDGTYIVNVQGFASVTDCEIESLTNGLFRFGTVKDVFDCSNCKKLTSLKGAPEHVGGDFCCANCVSLKTLEGAPKEVGKCFKCSGCDGLKTLEGVSEIISGGFDCFMCDNLVSLKGIPKKVTGNFSCAFCPKLKTLENGPEEVTGRFSCAGSDSLTSLKGCPSFIGSDLVMNYCPRLRNLNHVQHVSGTIFCKECYKLKITDKDRDKWNIELT